MEATPKKSPFMTFVRNDLSDAAACLAATQELLDSGTQISSMMKALANQFSSAPLYT